MSEARGVINKVRDLKSTSDTLSMKKKKGTITGGFIGMAGGLLYGVAKGYNLVSSAFIGAVIGGIASHFLLPKNDEDEE
jgi:outer membrane lipoprotein SlyB